jgi:hypothetical protein
LKCAHGEIRIPDLLVRGRTDDFIVFLFFNHLAGPHSLEVGTVARIPNHARSPRSSESSIAQKRFYWRRGPGCDYRFS